MWFLQFVKHFFELAPLWVATETKKITSTVVIWSEYSKRGLAFNLCCTPETEAWDQPLTRTIPPAVPAHAPSTCRHLIFTSIYFRPIMRALNLPLDQMPGKTSAKTHSQVFLLNNSRRLFTLVLHNNTVHTRAGIWPSRRLAQHWARHCGTEVISPLATRSEANRAKRNQGSYSGHFISSQNSFWICEHCLGLSNISSYTETNTWDWCLGHFWPVDSITDGSYSSKRT